MWISRHYWFNNTKYITKPSSKTHEPVYCCQEEYMMLGTYCCRVTVRRHCHYPHQVVRLQPLPLPWTHRSILGDPSEQVLGLAVQAVVFLVAAERRKVLESSRTSVKSSFLFFSHILITTSSYLEIEAI